MKCETDILRKKKEEKINWWSGTHLLLRGADEIARDEGNGGDHGAAFNEDGDDGEGVELLQHRTLCLLLASEVVDALRSALHPAHRGGSRQVLVLATQRRAGALRRRQPNELVCHARLRVVDRRENRGDNHVC